MTTTKSKKTTKDDEAKQRIVTFGKLAPGQKIIVTKPPSPFTNRGDKPYSHSKFQQSTTKISASATPPTPQVKPKIPTDVPYKKAFESNGPFDNFQKGVSNFNGIPKKHGKRKIRWWFSYLVFFSRRLRWPEPMVGYVRSYNRFFRFKQLSPRLYPLRPINRVAMVIGIVIAWLIVVALYFLIVYILGHLGFNAGAITAFLLTNLVFSSIVFGFFKVWQSNIEQKLIQDDKFGSARFARNDELAPLRSGLGYFLGSNLHYFERGHLLLVGGTRGGKGANIIIPNLLGAGEVQTSWIVIDPKGENAAITARYQRSTGQKVVILNPWNLLRTG